MRLEPKDHDITHSVVMNGPVFTADSSDPGIKHAVKLAQQTFRISWRELSCEYRRIVPGLDMTCVKAAFSDSDDVQNADDVELMWISEVTFDGKTICHTLINEPNWLQTIAQGPSVQLKPSPMRDGPPPMRADARNSLGASVGRFLHAFSGGAMLCF